MLQWRGIAGADTVNRLLQLMIIQIWLILVIIPCHKRDSEGLIMMFAWQIQTKCFLNVSQHLWDLVPLFPPSKVNHFSVYQMHLTDGNPDVLDVPIWASYFMEWNETFVKWFEASMCVVWTCWHVSENMFEILSYSFHVWNDFSKMFDYSFFFFFFLELVIWFCIHLWQSVVSIGCNLTKFHPLKK